MRYDCDRQRLWRTRTLRLYALAVAFGAPTFCQIPQDHPELCGHGRGTVELPTGINTVSRADRAGAELTVKRRDGSTKSIELRTPEGTIQQVCPIGQDKLLVFGAVGDAYIAWVLSQVTGERVDGLRTRDPKVSPDQHWLAYRNWYPASAELPFEEYLLYDLTKDAVGNQLADSNPRDPDPAGRLMYPVTAKRVTLHRMEVTTEQAHAWASTSFFWSPDSRFVAFADRLGEANSIVVVQIAADDLTTYVHRLETFEICTGEGLGPEVASSATLSDVEFTSARGGNLPDVFARFSPDYPGSKDQSCNKTLLLNASNLKPAPIEVHKPLRH